MVVKSAASRSTLDQGIKQDKLTGLRGGKVVGRIFWNVAKGAGTELDPSLPNLDPAGAFNHVTDDVFVCVFDLFRICSFAWAERDQAAVKVL